ncbi:MAG: TonB-dependent receptor [Bacteroidota bacterium]
MAGYSYASANPSEESSSNELRKAGIEITGTVRDAEGIEIPGANIFVKGTTTGTITDMNGYYSIEVPDESATLVFSFIGYATQEVVVGSRTVINVEMAVDAAGIEELVVVGFGKQKKISVTGAITAVNPDILKTPSSSLSSSFAGRMPGVIAVQRSGEPGQDGSDFWIRGVSTFGAGSSNNPLIFLDGVQISNADLNALDPSIIENFTILKDASATALYGARGANGVILIVTKDGIASDKPMVSVRVESSLKSPTMLPEYSDAVTFMEMSNEARFNSNPERPLEYTQQKIDGTMQGLDPYLFPNVDWMSTVFKDYATHQYANVNIRGGSEKVQYFTSVSYTDDTGLMREGPDNDNNINFKRFNLQNNLTYDLSNSTKLDVRINTNFDSNNRPWMWSTHLYQLVLRSNPVNFPVTFPDEEGVDHIKFGSKPGGDGLALPNPYASLVRGYVGERSTTLLGLAKLTQDIKWVEGLSAEVMVSVKNYANSGFTRLYEPFYYMVDESSITETDGVYDYDVVMMGQGGNTALNFGSWSAGRNSAVYIQSSINYNKSFGKHDIQSMLVYNQNDFRDNNAGSFYSALPYRNQGLAARISYMYDNRYMLETNMGYTGSENFAPDHRFGFFPSISVGYAISNEKFFQETLGSLFSVMKIRASYGLAGNDQAGGIIRRFPYRSSVDLNYSGLNHSFGSDFNNWANGVVINTYENVDVTWEISHKANVGIDLEMRNGLILTADLFRDYRTGILLQRSIVPTTLGAGAALPLANSGELVNRGIDIALNYNKAVTSDLIITAMGTFTFARNEVLAADEPPGFEENYPHLSKVGKPVNTMWGYDAEYIFSDQEDVDNSAFQSFGGYGVGDLKFRDVTGDGIVDMNDLIPLGAPYLPEITYGFGFSIQYKKFDFSTFFQGIGRLSMGVGGGMHPFSIETESNVMTFIADDYWSPGVNEDPYATYPRVTEDRNDNNRQFNSWWLRKGSFMRWKDAEFGYRISKMIRVYLQGQNMLTFSDFKLWDPEMLSPDGASYPPQRNILIGAQFNF